MSLRMLLSAAAAAASLVVGAAGAHAMTLQKATQNITTKATNFPSVGSPNPAVVSQALASCLGSPSCAGWYEKFSEPADIYSWDDGATERTQIVHGMIRGEYNALGGANSFLGLPRTDESNTPNNTGRTQTFAGGRFYYKWGASSAHEVHGLIWTKYNVLGATASALGFPITNEMPNGAGRVSTFEKGYIYWSGAGTSWQNDTWPVMTVPASYPMSRTTWLVGRPIGTTATFDVFGCGFNVSAPVTLHLNTPTQRITHKTATTDATGCVQINTASISSSYLTNGIATFELDDGTHFAVAGVARAGHECTALAPDTTTFYEVGRTSHTVWCAEPGNFRLTHEPLRAFDLDFTDRAYAQLADDFGIPFPGLPFRVEVGPWIDDKGLIQTKCSIAHTGTIFGAGVFVPIGCFSQVRTAPDGTSVTAAGAFILLAQEIVNNFTGGLAGIWPTDWWADHRSPFPTFVNWNLLTELGQPDAADINFYDNHDDPSPLALPGFVGAWTWDPQTDMFQALKDGCITSPCKGVATYGDWGGFATMFQAMKADQIDLGLVGQNPSQLRSDYVIAYMSLGHGVDLTGLVDSYGVGERPGAYIFGNPVDCWTVAGGCNTSSSPDIWTDYTLSATEVATIADAHCQIGRVATVNATLAGNARAALRAGDYTTALNMVQTTALCTNNAQCPSECACNATAHICTAPWH